MTHKPVMTGCDPCHCCDCITRIEIDELYRKLDEMRFDARVALPEAQERFRRAETALRHLLRFGERLMQSESMEERAIGCSICEGARIVAAPTATEDGER